MRNRFRRQGDDFVAFANGVAQAGLEAAPESLEALLAVTLPSSGTSVEETRRALVAKLGENINVRRYQRFHSEQGWVASYLHGTRIGVLVELVGGDAELGKDLAMHIAASKPLCVDAGQVPGEVIAKEREIYTAQAEASGKPANVIDKMVEGRIQKFLGEITLLGQPFVKHPEQTVAKLLSERQASVVRFVRFEVGEGIEKTETNFAEEVMAQVRGA